MNDLSVLPERFWQLLTVLSVAWYLTVTAYVAVRGAMDIRHMLARLQKQNSRDVNETAAP